MNTCIWVMEDDSLCGELCEGRTQWCASHGRQLRKEAETSRKQSEKRVHQIALQKAKSKIPRTKVKKVSPKREELNKEYAKRVKEFKDSNPNCAGRIESICTGTTQHCHHSHGRGKYLLDESTWIPLCAPCHEYVHQNPLDAMKRNLSFSRLAKQTPTI